MMNRFVTPHAIFYENSLSKLRQTQENVAELKTGLAAKTIELREKETLANNKLQQMVADQVRLDNVIFLQ